MVRFDPEAAEAKRREAAERRHVDVRVDEVTFDGTVHIDAEVDLADALDLEEALRLGAKQQADLGSTEPLDVRRSIALGDLARRQLALEFEPTNPADDRWCSTRTSPNESVVGRCGNTRTPISVEQIKEWCASAAQVVVKPVIDLTEHIHVEAYEAPGRLKEQNVLVDVHCVHPYCTRPAHRCDCDHVDRARQRRHDLLLQHRAAMPTPPPRQDPLRVELRRARPRHLPVDYTQRTPADPRPPRHASGLTTPPHTPARQIWPGLSARACA